MDLGGDVLKLLLPCQSPLPYQGVALARSSSLKTGTDCDRPSDAVKSLNSEAAKTEEDTGKREQTFQLLRDHQELARPWRDRNMNKIPETTR